MKRRSALLAAIVLGLTVTGCPLTDHYQLLSDSSPSVAGVGGDESGGAPWVAGTGGDGSGGAPVGGRAPSAGASGASSSGAGGATTFGGNAGTASCGDTQSDARNCGDCGVACDVGRSCQAGACQSGWVGMAQPALPFLARYRAAAVAMGDLVFIWGGVDRLGNVLADGGIYDPTADQWVLLPSGNGSPTARKDAAAVWTGKVVVVFGGSDVNSNSYKDGGIYDPNKNLWAALPVPPTLAPRSLALSFWDGTHAVFWGGTAASAPVAGVDRFDLTRWTPASGIGNPGALTAPAFAVDKSSLYLQGGQLGPSSSTCQDKASFYNAVTDRWTPLQQSWSARSGGFGAWDGSHFVVWGGRDSTTALQSDGRYLSGTTWTPMAATNVLAPRAVALGRTGWSFGVKPGVVAFLGGQVASGVATNGATYNTMNSQWTAIPEWSTTDLHENGMGVWTGKQFVVFGGRDANGPTVTGHRWAP